jgi:uncharacterized protein YhaN
MSDSETNAIRIDVLLARLECEEKMRLALEKLLDERDRANKEAVKAAFASAEKAYAQTELSLKEYKSSANEWRSTVNDLVSRMSAKGEGLHQGWVILLGLAALAGTIASVVMAFKK